MSDPLPEPMTEDEFWAWATEKKVYRCTICGETPVDAENGYDTCELCLKTRI